MFIERLKQWVGISGSALDWFSSYLSDLTSSNAVASSTESRLCAVPRGSVLGPKLFALDMVPLGHLISNSKGISCNYYADDIRLYISITVRLKTVSSFKSPQIYKRLDG